jgi:hypothetical protein
MPLGAGAAEEALFGGQCVVDLQPNEAAALVGGGGPRRELLGSDGWAGGGC